jgi:phosphoenolpyruvate carboxylase
MHRHSRRTKASREDRSRHDLSKTLRDIYYTSAIENKGVTNRPSTVTSIANNSNEISRQINKSRQIDKGAGRTLLMAAMPATSHKRKHEQRLQQAVYRVGPSSSLSLAAHPRDGATTGVCWSFSGTGTLLSWGNIVTTNPDPMEHARIHQR